MSPTASQNGNSGLPWEGKQICLQARQAARWSQLSLAFLVEEPSDRPLRELAADPGRSPPSPGHPTQVRVCCSLGLCFSNTCRIPRLPFLPVGKASSLLLRKKTHCDVKMCFLALPFTNGARVNQRHMGYISLERHSSSKANLAKGMRWGGRGVASAHPEPLSASQRSQQHHTPSIYPGGSPDLPTSKPRHCV